MQLQWNRKGMVVPNGNSCFRTRDDIFRGNVQLFILDHPVIRDHIVFNSKESESRPVGATRHPDHARSIVISNIIIER